MTMASSKKLTEHEEHRLTEGILDNIFKLVLKGKLKQIESPSLGKFYEEKKVDETMRKEKYPNKT